MTDGAGVVVATAVGIGVYRTEGAGTAALEHPTNTTTKATLATRMGSADGCMSRSLLAKHCPVKAPNRTFWSQPNPFRVVESGSLPEF